MTEKNPNKKRCGAKTRSGEPCKNWGMTNGRCRMHGGKSLRGIASPSYVHGRHSKYLPTRMAERYVESVNDPELLNLSAEIALVDARVSDVLGRVDSGESGRRWRQLGSLRSEFMAAQRREDQQGMADALADILNGIRQGQADFEAWSEVVDLLERRRRLVESEQKRRIAMQLVVKVEEAVGAMHQIADVVRGAVLEHVDDGATRRRVLGDVQHALDRYLGGGVPEQVAGEGGNGSGVVC